MRLADLVNWYLKEVEAEIDTVQELTDKKLLVEKVIDRLVNHVSSSSLHTYCMTGVSPFIGPCAVAVGDGGGRGRRGCG